MDIHAIYERQYARVYRIAMLYMKNSSDAEDVVQGVFVKYIEKSLNFRDLEHEKAWFITVARNQCKDILKNYWRSRVALGEIPEQAEAATEEVDLMPYIFRLAPKYKEVLYLYYYEEYSTREMAFLLKRNHSTIRTQLESARKKLRQILEQEGVSEYGR